MKIKYLFPLLLSQLTTELSAIDYKANLGGFHSSPSGYASDRGYELSFKNDLHWKTSKNISVGFDLENISDSACVPNISFSAYQIDQVGQGSFTKSIQILDKSLLAKEYIKSELTQTELATTIYWNLYNNHNTKLKLGGKLSYLHINLDLDTASRGLLNTNQNMFLPYLFLGAEYKANERVELKTELEFTAFATAFMYNAKVGLNTRLLELGDTQLHIEVGAKVNAMYNNLFLIVYAPKFYGAYSNIEIRF